MANMADSLDIGMGEIRVRGNPAVLACLGLGSCVALFLYDGTSRIGGVAHIMLPESSQARPETSGNRAKFADTAPKLLLKRLKGMGADESQIVAKVVGGADMFPQCKTEILSDLGSRSVKVIKSELAAMNIPVVSQDTGGNLGRSCYFDLVTGKVKVKTAFGQIKNI